MRGTTITFRNASLAILILSLLCNVAALFLPFLDIRKGVSTTSYSLFKTVTMLWDKELYLLTALVFAFSIVFPLAKLGALGWIWFMRGPRRIRLQLLHWLERLGKWSLLDVYLAAIILILGNDQFFLGAEPSIGIPLFAFAIALSMLAGEMLCSQEHAEDEAGASNRSTRGPGRIMVWTGVCISGVLLGLALCYPFIAINDWLLVNRSYSIVGMAFTLLSPSGWFAAAPLIIFLILAPLAQFTALVALAITASSSSRAWLHRCFRWSMLDVFALALVVFLVEGQSMMDTDLRMGALFLALLVVINQTIMFGSARLVRSPGSTAPTPDGVAVADLDIT